MTRHNKDMKERKKKPFGEYKKSNSVDKGASFIPR